MAKATAVLQVMVSGATKFKNDITGTQKTTNSAFASMSKESKKAMASMVAQYASVAVVIAKTTKVINKNQAFNLLALFLTEIIHILDTSVQDVFLNLFFRKENFGTLAKGKTENSFANQRPSCTH